MARRQAFLHTCEMGELADLLARIEAVCSRASGRGRDERLAAEIEDLLAEGYIEALRAESRSLRLRARLEQLADTIEQPDDAIEARRIALERLTIDRRVSVLRSRLQVMRTHFVRLSGGRSAAS